MIPDLTITEYETHPAATLFPMMEYKDLIALRHDIVAYGQRETIKLFEGKILDGRNRYFVCRQANITPIFEIIKTNNPSKYVLSQNLHRRHLSESQRAIIAEQLSNAQICAKGQKLTQGNAALAMKVSRRSVTNAKIVRQNASPDVYEAVQNGQMTLSAAVSSIDLIPSEAEKFAADLVAFVDTQDALSVSKVADDKLKAAEEEVMVTIILRYKKKELDYIKEQAIIDRHPVEHFVKVRSLQGYDKQPCLLGRSYKSRNQVLTHDELRLLETKEKKELHQFNNAMRNRELIKTMTESSIQVDANSQAYSTL